MQSDSGLARWLLARVGCDWQCMNARPDAGPESVWLARILGAGAILETGVGLVLLVDPSGLASLLLRSPLEGAGLVFARIGGGGVLSLGIACWCARETRLMPAELGVSRAFLAYNLVAYVTLALANASARSRTFNCP